MRLGQSGRANAGGGYTVAWLSSVPNCNTKMGGYTRFCRFRGSLPILREEGNVSWLTPNTAIGGIAFSP